MRTFIMSATASRVLLLAATAITGTSDLAGAQTLAQRIARAPDGTIRLAFASRAEVCGNGKDVVRVGNQIFVGSSTTVFMGRGSLDARGYRECLPGDVHVTMTKSGGEVVGVKTIIAREAKTTDGTNLGIVSQPEAARYFLTLAPLSEERANKQAVLPAILADSAVIWPDLLRIANNTRYGLKLRSRMLHWVGVTGEAAAIVPLDAIVRDESAASDLRDAALGALAELPDGLGMPSLTRIANGAGPVSLRKKAVFWLGQSDDESARRVVLTLVKNESTPEEVRGDGIFALGQSGDPDDLRQLRTLYPTLKTRKLKEKVIMGASQSGDAESLRWIVGVALDEAETREVRKQALFWAGQGDTPIKELIGLWSRIDESSLREHLLFVFSQRDESEATDKLISIARGDPSMEIRKKAMFWLGQKDDEQAAKFIREVLKP